MVIEYSAAVQIEQLAPLLETMPSGVVSEMQYTPRVLLRRFANEVR